MWYNRQIKDNLNCQISERGCYAVGRFKVFIMKIIAFSLFILCLSVISVCAQTEDEIQLYNRNEKVLLSKPLICSSDDYFISVDDLSKINIQYKFTENEDGFEFKLYSKDYFGTENTLEIEVILDELNIWDANTGGFVSVPFYSYKNTMQSKKSIHIELSGMQLITIDMGEFDSVYITEENDYYISLYAIKTAISYEYTVKDNGIYLWITDSNHHVINGEISLPDGETAQEEGVDVDILVLNPNKELTGEYSLKTVHIPHNEKRVYYFIETDIPDKYNGVMFEFEGDYKTVNKYVSTNVGGWLEVETSPTEKTDFNVNVRMPNLLKAEEDIYAMVIFENCAVCKTNEPIIKKGETRGKVTLSIDKEFVGKVAFSEISGDNRIFDYGYFGYIQLALLSDKASFVHADNGGITARLMQCYEISGQVVPADINSGYKVKVFGVTDIEEEICLYDEIGGDFTFSIKVPSSVPEYTLSVAYKPGVYCGYIADGVSDYSSEYYVFENKRNYTEVKLKYEQYLPDLPVSIEVNARLGYVDIKNISDDVITDITLYCAHYRKDELIYVSSVFVDTLMAYDDYKTYKFEYPAEFYKTDEVRFFVWDNKMKPLCLLLSKKVNEPEYAEDREFEDVGLSHQYYIAIKAMYCSGIMLSYSDDTFHPDDNMMRGQAAMKLCKMMGFWCEKYKFSCDDIPKSNWASSFVGICVNENIFELQDNKFRPMDNITIYEVYEAVQNLAKRDNIEITRQDILINIDGENMERDITRGEFAQMMYNYKVFTGQMNR